MKKLTLWETYFKSDDATAKMDWHIYDAQNHNKLVTSDYGKASYTDVSEDMDAKLVVSIKINAGYVGVYIK